MARSLFQLLVGLAVRTLEALTKWLRLENSLRGRENVGLQTLKLYLGDLFWVGQQVAVKVVREVTEGMGVGRWET